MIFFAWRQVYKGLESVTDLPLPKSLRIRHVVAEYKLSFGYRSKDLPGHVWLIIHGIRPDLILRCVT